MPPKRIIRYRSQIDYDKTYAKAIELEYVPIRTGGRHSAGESPEAQITLDFQRFGLDCKANIYHNGKIQISYLSKPHLHKTVRLLKRCLVPCTGKKIKLEEEKYDFDPLDRSVQHTVTENWQYSGARFFQAKVLLYIWLDTKKDEYIYRTPNKEGLVNIPGTQYHVKPERLRYLANKGPYKFVEVLEVSASTIDKFNRNGRKVITAERAGWQAVKELKRVIHEHPRFKATGDES